MDFEEWSALKKSGKSVLWPHRHIIRKARVRHHSWAEIAELLETKGVRVHFTNIQKWYARQDWDQIDAELSPKPQAQAARPVAHRVHPVQAPRAPQERLIPAADPDDDVADKYITMGRNAVAASQVVDEDEENAPSIIEKFLGSRKA